MICQSPAFILIAAISVGFGSLPSEPFHECISKRRPGNKGCYGIAFDDLVVRRHGEAVQINRHLS